MYKKPAQSWSWPDDAAARTMVDNTCASRRPIASRVRWVKMTATTRSSATTAAPRARERVVVEAEDFSVGLDDGSTEVLEAAAEDDVEGARVLALVVEVVAPPDGLH